MKKAILSFYEQWKEEALVIDQWFTVQTSDTRPSLIDDVKKLLEHKDFDFKNPNRVRSVLAVFAQNYEFFHEESGQGYAFFAEQIKVLNDINPQIAARLVWRFGALASLSGRARCFDEKAVGNVKSITRFV